MTCVFNSKDGVNSFTCYRGGSKPPKPIIQLINKQGEILTSEVTLEYFQNCNHNAGITVKNYQGKERQVIRSYLDIYTPKEEDDESIS